MEEKSAKRRQFWGRAMAEKVSKCLDSTDEAII